MNENLQNISDLPEDDDVSGNYLLGRQVAHELNGPAMAALRKYGHNTSQVAQDGEPVKPDEMPAEPPEDLEALAKAHLEEVKKTDTQGLKEPWLDPVSAFSGGFGATGGRALLAGAKLLPSLGRATAAGLVGAGADYPIGFATERVRDVAPWAALPFNVLTGMVSGATIENAIERRVVAALGKTAGHRAIAKEVKKVRKALESGVEDETTKQVLDDLRGEVPANKLLDKTPDEPLVKIEELPGSGVPKNEKQIGDAADAVLDADPSGRGKYAVNINFNRIDTTDQVKDIIDQVAQTFEGEIDDARRGIRTHADTQKAAGLCGMTVESLLKRRKGEAFNPEQAYAARKILVSSAENLHGLAQKVRTLEATDLDKFEFQKALNLHYAIQTQVSGMTAEAGRALNSFNIKAGASEIRTKQIKDLMGQMPGGMSAEKMADAITSFETPEQIGTFVKQVRRATTADMVYEAWINGLLSGPATHAVNTLSNTLTAFWQIPERFLAAGIGKISGSDGVRAQEATAQAFGLVEGFRDGLKAFGRAVRTGLPADAVGKQEHQGYRSLTAENVRELPLVKKLSPDALQDGGVAARAVDLLGETVRLPGRFLTAEDELFKTVGYRMELNALAYRTAAEEGLKGEDAARRIKQILIDPETYAPNVHLAAMDAARYQTFTRPLGESGQALQKFIRKVPGLRYIVPFVRTPTNILKFAFERTPMAFVSKNIRADIAAGGARRDLALARISTGAMVMSVAATMTAAGQITGGGPSDPKMKSIKYNTGWQPYSVKIGDKYHAFNRLEPAGMLLGMAADAVEIMGMMDDEDERDKLASAVLMAISKNVTSKTWLRGVSELIEAVDDPDRYGNRYVQKFLGTVVPTGVAQIERVMSPEMEAVHGYMDAIKSRIPGLSKDLPPRRNMWAEPIVLGGGVGPDIISPVYTSEAVDSPIDEELLRMKMPLSMPQETQAFEGVPIRLEPKEYDRFLVLMNETPLNSTGKPLKRSMDELVKSYEYRDAPDETKEMMIRGKLLEARQLAKTALMDESATFRRIIDQYQRLKSNQ